MYARRRYPPHQEHKKIVCIARLSGEKHQDLLIKAFAQIAPQFPDWSVELYGNGPKYDKYKNLIESVNCNQISLMGTTSDVLGVLKTTDIFVLPSLIEGFPLVLTEAMGYGLPAIGMKCCDGTNEIIINNKSGILCDDSIDSMKNALIKLMGNKQLRATYGINAKKQMEQFSSDNIWDLWLNIINKTITTGK